MKILKMTILCLVETVVLVFALMYHPGRYEQTPIETDNPVVSQMCDDIRKAWQNESDFNEQLYIQQKNDLEIDRKSKRDFSARAYQTVLNTLVETVTNKVCDSYMNALEQNTNNTKSERDNVQNHFQFVESVKQNELLTNDPRINKVEHLNSIYEEATSLFFKATLSPKYNAMNNSWTNYDEDINNLVSRARKCKEDSLFYKIEHIKGLKDGLEESSVRKRIRTTKYQYYSTIDKQIVEYFKKLDYRDSNNFDKLQAAYNQLNTVPLGAEGKYSCSTNLSELLRKYYDNQQKPVQQ